MTEDLALKEIDNIVKNNPVVLFMKGTSDFPQCGFSGAVVSIFKKMGVSFKDINVLENMSLREAVKKYSDWPTIPQLYIRGEFIGGCDITRELYENGELEELLKHPK
ncbi:MAG: Grx4 family monothiol glutaredoxin [Pseudomonadota bacterium]